MDGFDVETLDIENLSAYAVQVLALVPRVMVATMLIPVFASRYLPAGARFGVALAMVWVAALAEPLDSAATGASGAAYGLLLLKEAGIGLMIGLSFAMVFWVARAIGELVDYQTASTFSQNTDPVNGQNASTLGMFIEKVFIVYTVAAGGLLIFAEVLLLSYSLWPVGQLVPDLIQRASPLLIMETSRLFALGLLLAGPMMLIVFMIDIGFGLIGRTAPQLNLLNLTLPLKAPVAVFVLMLALPFLLSRLFSALGSVRTALVTLLNG
ncbi:MAG: type III secretion system export apparatus subunit SctT [Burkholderiaceae bacterium]